MSVAVSDDDLTNRLYALFESNPLCSFDGDTRSLPAWALAPVLNQLARDLGTQPLSQASIESLQATSENVDDAVDVTVDQVLQILPHLFLDLRISFISPAPSPTGLAPSDTRSDGSASSSGRDVFRSNSSSPEPDSETYSPPRTPPANALTLTHMRSVSGGSASSLPSPFDMRPRTSPLTPAGHSPFDIRQRSSPLTPTGSVHTRIRRPQALFRRHRSDSSSTSGSRDPTSESDGRPPSPPSGSVSPHSIDEDPSSVAFPLAWNPNDGALGGRSVSQSLHRRRTSVEPQFAAISELDWEEHPEYLGSEVEDPDFRRMASLLDTPRRRTLSSPEDYDTDGDETGLVQAPRSYRNSAASMAPEDRLNALTQENEDLVLRLQDRERAMQVHMAEHEIEFQELESRLSEVEQELAQVKREEKELRYKDRSNTTQINMLEQEILKLQRALEASCNGYQSIQKQFQDQIASIESLRNALRAKEVDVQYASDLAQHHAAEARRYAGQRELAEAHAAQLEEELAIARETAASANEQLEENALLRETIERMRMDIDELRGPGPADKNGTPPRQGSRPPTINRSLGVEMLMQLADAEKKRFLESGGSSGLDSVDRSLDLEMMKLQNEAAESSKKIAQKEGSSYQTVIKRKRKIASRAVAPSRFLPTKSIYADAFAQHQPEQSTSGVQTDDIDTSGSEPSTSPLNPPSTLAAPQTPPRRTVVHRRSMQEQEDYDDDLFNMILAPVSPTSPTRKVAQPRPGELPPSYAQLFTPQKLMNPRALAARDAVAHWHRGAPIPLAPVPGGVSREALAAWGKLKGELGVDCMVIDKILAVSATRTPPASPPSTHATLRRRRSQSISLSTPATAPHGPAPAHSRQSPKQMPPQRNKAGGRRRWRFSDLWNVYAARNELPRKMFYPIVVLGAWTAVVVVATPFITHYFAVPGVPDVGDRAALSALRTLAGGAGEGFRGGPRDDALDAVWIVIERLLLGSANAVLRVPVPT